MPGPEQLIRGAVALPLGLARRVLGLVGEVLPGGGGDEHVPATQPPDVTRTDDLAAAVAADDAMTREREPVEEAPLQPEDDLGGHIEPEVEVVAESADPEATDPPGAEVHGDDALRRG